MNRQRTMTMLFVFWLAGSSLLVLVTFLFASSDVWRIARTTFQFGLSAAAISVPVGFLIAWAHARTGGTLANLCLILILSTILVPLHLHVAVWDSAMGKLGWFRPGGGFQPLMSGFGAAVWVQSIAAIPWSALIGSVAIRTGGFQLEQQCLLDAGGWRVFWSVTFRRLLPFFLLAVIWVVVLSSREIAATDIYQVGTFAEEVYLQFSGGRFDWFGMDPVTGEPDRPLGLWPYVLITIWFVATTVLCVMGLVPGRQFDLSRVSPLPAKAIQKSAWRLFLLLGTLILFAVPFFNLAIRAGLRVERTDSGPIAKFSMEHFLHAVSKVPGDYRVEWLWSLGIGALTAFVVAVIVSTWAGKCKSEAGIRIWTLLFIICVSLALPGPVIGLLVAKCFSAINWAPINWLYDRTIVAPVMATCLMAFGPAAFLMMFLFRTISQEAMDAAELEGVGRQRVFSKLTFAQIAPGFFVCLLVCFLIGYSDLSASYIPMPPGIDTLPRRMLGQMHAGVNDMTAALSLVNLIIAGTISLAAIMIVVMMRNRAGQQKSGE